MYFVPNQMTDCVIDYRTCTLNNMGREIVFMTLKSSESQHLHKYQELLQLLQKYSVRLNNVI